MSSCIVHNVLLYISIYAWWPQWFHVARVLLYVLSTAAKPRHIPLRQSRPYQPREVFFSVFQFELAPFSDGQISRVSARPTAFYWEKYWARICTAVVYLTRRRKNWIWGHHEGHNQSTFRRDGKWEQTNTITIARWGHESITSNRYEDIIKEYISETGEEGKPGP